MNTQKFDGRTAKRVLSSLKNIYAIFKYENSLSVATVFKINNLHPDYAKILHDNKVLIRTDGGRRGRGKYKWVNPEPTIELAEKCVKEYNIKRANANGYLTTKRQTATKEINDKLDLIISFLKIKK